jgi:hypothetical protein
LPGPSRVHPGDDGAAGRAVQALCQLRVGDRPVGEGVRSELLHHVHHDVEPGVVGVDQFQGLGPEAEGHDVRTVGAGGLRGSPGQRHHQVAHPCPALHEPGLGDVHRRRADEAGDEDVGRTVVEGARRVGLLQQPVLEDGDAVAHGHGLDLVVRDVDGGDAEPALQGGDLRAGLDAELRVQIGQRFVHEEHLRRTHDRATHRHALPLPTGQRLGPAVQVRLQVEDLRRFLDAGRDLALPDAGDLEGEAHVVGDRHVRVQGVVLEHHGDVPVLRRHLRDVALADEDGAAVDLLETSEHAQGCRLAATGGADEDRNSPSAIFRSRTSTAGSSAPGYKRVAWSKVTEATVGSLPGIGGRTVRGVDVRRRWERVSRRAGPLP